MPNMGLTNQFLNKNNFEAPFAAAKRISFSARSLSFLIPRAIAICRGGNG